MEKGHTSGRSATSAEIKANINTALHILRSNYLGAHNMQSGMHITEGTHEKNHRFTGSNGHASFLIFLSKNVMTCEISISIRNSERGYEKLDFKGACDEDAERLFNYCAEEIDLSTLHDAIKHAQTQFQLEQERNSIPRIEAVPEKKKPSIFDIFKPK